MLLTGQRPADVLKIKRTDVRDGALWIVQNKTKWAIEITGELAALIERINAWPLAGVDFQFRDIRAKAATHTGDPAPSPRVGAPLPDAPPQSKCGSLDLLPLGSKLDIHIKSCK